MSMLGRLLDRSGQKKRRRPRTKAELEKRRRLLIVILIITAVVAATVTVGYGYYDTSVRPWRQPILEVNGTVIDMRTFVNHLRLHQQYSGYFSSESEWAQYVVSVVEQNEMNRQYLQGHFPGVDLAAVTSDEEVDRKVREELGLADNSTQEEYDQAYRNLEEGLKSYGVSVSDFRKLYVEPLLISAELQKQIGDRDYPATGSHDHARVQALLVSGADQASLARMKWENGAAFDTLAGESWVSESIGDTLETDSATPRWVPRSTRGESFDNCTFSIPVGMLSDPVPEADSFEEYWLVNVLARESRQLTEEDRDRLVSDAVSMWLEEAMASPENVIVNYLDQEGGAARLAWAVKQAAV